MKLIQSAKETIVLALAINKRAGRIEREKELKETEKRYL